MKTTTFHFLAMAAREYLDFSAMGLSEEVPPLQHFVNTGTVPSKKMIKELVRVYDEKELTVTVGRSSTPVGIREAVTAMSDVLGVSITDPRENRAIGRPSTSKRVDLSELRHLVLKNGYKLRDLASLADMYPSTLSMCLNSVTRLTPDRIEQIFSGAQMLFTGNQEALKELRAMEKAID